MQSDSAVGRGNIVVCLPEHGIDAVQCQKLTEKFMSQSVYVQQTLQLLTTDREKRNYLNAELFPQK